MDQAGRRIGGGPRAGCARWIGRRSAERSGPGGEKSAAEGGAMASAATVGGAAEPAAAKMQGASWCCPLDGGGERSAGVCTAIGTGPVPWHILMR